MPASSPASTQQLIDRVVREVLSRLHPAGESGLPANPSAEEPRGERSTRDEACLTLADHVVSIACLADVPLGVKRIRLEPDAVMTPAARDLARERGIVWIRQGEAAPTTQQAVAVADTDSPQRAAGLIRQLASRGLATQATDPGSLLGQIGQGCVHGLVLSDLPAGFVCQACRNGSIRAAAIGELNELEPITAQLRPNLWVIDMRRVSLSKAIVLAERVIRQLHQGATP